MILLSLNCLFVSGQTEIKGVINLYSVIESFDVCAGSVIVQDPQGFVPGMKTMIYQAQGAIIDERNSGAFGNITDLRNAGKYEVATIDRISGNEIYFKSPLLNDYDVNQGLQLISIPDFESAVVIDTLTAKAWDGKTGGVLVFSVAENLTLKAPIDVSGKGFRGGISTIDDGNDCNFLVPVNNYFVGLNDWRGAMKGEGITGSISGKEAGRGPLANGGGGGNDHNAGGGGGGHLSNGGNGGNNEEPSTFGCDGRRPGIGGKTISTVSDRLFFGGGGGAGHENNDVGSNGGNGGGIVLIVTKKLVGNGYQVLANGITPEDANGDGAGGGGAGGTVLLSVTEVLDGNLTVSSTGGDGGIANNKNFSRCMGPGGGGAGGRVLLNAPIALNTSVNGGEAGRSINSSACSESANGASSGGQGSIEMWDGQLRESSGISTIAISDQAITPVCESQTKDLIAFVGAGLENLSWEAGDGTSFTALEEGFPFTGVNTERLTIASISQSLDSLFFRIAATGICGNKLYSNAVQLMLIDQPVADFSSEIIGLEAYFNSLSDMADSIIWDFGDGQISNIFSPQHTYEDYGKFLVSMHVFNVCGASSIQKEIELEDPNNIPSALLKIENQEGCAPLKTQFTDLSSGNIQKRMWYFPGGNPDTSSLVSPEVEYDEPGNYAVSLFVEGPQGRDSIIMEDVIRVYPVPEASFSYSMTDNEVVFENTSTLATSYFWNFGDDSTSLEQQPTHVFQKSGNYSVTLIAMNEFCSSSVSDFIFVTITNTRNRIIDEIIKVFPNPASEYLILENRAENQSLMMSIYSLEGKLLFSKVVAAGQNRISLVGLPSQTLVIKINDTMHGNFIGAVHVIRK